MITIYDIAKKTGYSIATVSKVINNYTGVSEKARNTIKRAIEEMDYTPNNYARTLATQRSWLIGVLFSEEKGLGIVHPHYSRILQSFQATIGNYGYDTLFLNNMWGGKKTSVLDHCKSRGVDGVVIAGSNNFTPTIQCVLDSDIPKVSVETIYSHVHTIISDNRMGTLQALEHLFFLGHRKIAHIASPLDGSAGWERHEAYKEFMGKKGLPYKKSYFVEASKYTNEAGADAITRLLEQCWDDMPTAIYASYDEYVSAAITVLASRGFRIPEDMSLVGFDDLPLAEYVTPAITTIHQNRYDIGSKAAGILAQIIAEEPIDEPYIVRIPTKLKVRQTTKRLKE